MKRRWSVILDYNCNHAVVGITITDNVVLATTTTIVHFTTLQQPLESSATSSTQILMLTLLAHNLDNNLYPF